MTDKGENPKKGKWKEGPEGAFWGMVVVFITFVIIFAILCFGR